MNKYVKRLFLLTSNNINLSIIANIMYLANLFLKVDRLVALNYLTIELKLLKLIHITFDNIIAADCE